MNFKPLKEMMSDFSFLSLQNRYIPALLLIALFSSLAFINVNEIMTSIHNDGKLINLSGRQRMLSQKLVVLARNYISNPSVKTKSDLLENIRLMESSHKYLIRQDLSKELKNIYYNQSLNKSLQRYLNGFYQILSTKDIKLLKRLSNDSQMILAKLDSIVYQYEKEDRKKLKALETKEFYLYLLILITLLLEAIFIFYPASKKIGTRTKYMEKEIESKTDQLQKSIDIISKNVIYSRTDLKGNITYASEAFCDITGYKNEELIGQPHNIIRHPDMPKEAFRDMWDAIKQEKTWEGEVKNLKKDGGFYWVEAHISPEYDIDGTHVGFAAVRHNITHRKELEYLNNTLNEKVIREVEKNRQKDQKLYEQEKMIQMDQMIRNIAHHWRQPLSVIATSASGMQLQKEYGLLDDKLFLESTEQILNNANDLSKIIDDFAKHIDGDSTSVIFDLKDRIDSSLSILNSTFIEEKITFNKIYIEEEVLINASTNNISQVILNIVYNAIDILHERKVESKKIDLNVDKDDKFAYVTIEDNGGGVPSEIISKIFEPYFTTKHQSLGTGMGLNICYNIVTKYLKGDLTVENIDNGARFIIKIPLVK